MFSGGTVNALQLHPFVTLTTHVNVRQAISCYIFSGLANSVESKPLHTKATLLLHKVQLG